MRKLLFVATCLLCIQLPRAYAQIINQDASGKSSIVTPGTSINLNITQTQIQGTHYGLFGKDKSGMYGIDLSANNSTGIGQLFDNGKFSPGGSIAGLIGKRWIKILDAATDRLHYQEVLKKLTDAQNALGLAYIREVERDVTASGLSAPDQNTVRVELEDLDESGLENLKQSLTGYKSSITDAAKVAQITSVVTLLTTFVDQQQAYIQTIQDQLNILPKITIPRLLRNQTTIAYFRGGYSASQFTYDLGATFQDYNKRFQDTTGKTLFLEIGVSHQFKKNFLGANLGYSHQDNMTALTSADYSYSYQDTTVSSGKLTKTKAFTAYSGTYGYYGRAYLNVDYQHLFTVDTSKYVAIGPYLRWSHNLKAGSLAKDATILGLSFNYLNGASGTFLGGIYVQSDDIGGHTQPKFNKSIQFGLVAKVNLSSVFVMK